MIARARLSTPPTEPALGCSPVVALAAALAVAIALLQPFLGPTLSTPAAIGWVAATLVLGATIGRLLRDRQLARRAAARTTPERPS